MQNCPDCGKKLGIMTPQVGPRCYNCHKENEVHIIENQKLEKAALAEKEARIKRIKETGTPQEKLNLAIELRDFSNYTTQELERILSQVKLTTAHLLYTHDILAEIEIVSAEVVEGMNIFKDLFAGMRDIVGGRSKAVQDTLREARENVLRELKIETICIGGNGVIGVHMDYHQMSAGTTSGMMMIVATGTAVAIKPKT